MIKLNIKDLRMFNFDDHYLEFENHNDKYKNLSLAQYLNENQPYSK